MASTPMTALATLKPSRPYHVTMETPDMNKPLLFLSLCCALMLQGCFDNSDNETKDNTDGAKSSIQMQQKDDAQPSK